MPEGYFSTRVRQSWIPAFAGMTEQIYRLQRVAHAFVLTRKAFAGMTVLTQ
jgi:hypothetical protein